MNKSGSKKIDKYFLAMTALLTIFGFVIFLSASLGLLAQDGANFNTIAMKQSISLVLGLIAFIIFAKINNTLLRKWALFIFLGAIAVNLLLFVPSLTLHYNGATRWLSLGPLTFQPSELLKIAFIIYIAAWVYFAKDKISSFKFGVLPFLIISAIISVLLLIQSDTDTLVIIIATGITMLFVAGMPLRHIFLVGLVFACLVGSVIVVRPYALQRVKTYLDGGINSQGSGYQINQSLIAIGSGQISGRGFGQSVQKFGYLPQPTDDSIFAVQAEEFGFIGSTLLILLYLSFAASIFRIGVRATDVFGSMVSIGIAVLIILESFMNIAAMLGLIPLSGMPLLFVSHGGTALIMTLAVAGIVANVSKTKASPMAMRPTLR